MPAKLEKLLYKAGRKRGLKGKRLDAYVYGSLRKIGWKPKK
jgi:hypothetical protein